MYTVLFSFNSALKLCADSFSCRERWEYVGYLEFNCFTPTTKGPVSLSEVFSRNVDSIFYRKSQWFCAILVLLAICFGLGCFFF